MMRLSSRTGWPSQRSASDSHWPRHRRPERRGARRGAALVEFAIIFPLLIILVFGVIDFGRAFFLRNNLVAAVREGARAAAVMAEGSAAPCGRATDIRNRVRSYVTAFGGTALTDAQLPLTFTGACGSGTTDITVRIQDYPFTPLTPVFRLIGRTGTININNISATYRWERSP
jgi:Flp pilus assembly protein TadG